MTAALDRMAGDLTAPFARGADTLKLSLTPGAGPGDATVAAYDFDEHRARFGGEPLPAYVVSTRADTGPARLTAGYEAPGPGGVVAGSAEVEVPDGTVAGASFALRLPPGAVLRTVHSDPAPPAGTAATWRVTALLGNLAKLLWVAGVERDVLDRHLNDVRVRVRSGAAATGAILDRHGYDLGVPRFPPLPYGQEDGTLVLYHLDDAAGEPVRDAWSLYSGGSGHPGTATGGVQAGAPGRFGAGLRFAVPGAEVTVPHAALLTTGPADDLTAECFVKPDPGIGDGVVLGKHADPDDPALPGWALSVGTFGRGIPRNVRLRIGDGATVRDLYADRTLPSARFTHLAAVLDRAAGQARLLVDGVVAAVAPLAAEAGESALTGSLGNTAPLRIGRAFTGTIDEVRLSAVARTGFHPVLGESDEGYRRRLRIFRRWVLPTPAGVRDALNEVVDDIAGVPEPFEVTDADARLVRAAHPLTVLPVTVPAGGSLDDTGRRGGSEADALGRAADDDAYDPDLLVDGADPRVVFAPAGVPAPGSRPADPRRMRPDTRAALRALLDRLASVPGKLEIRAGFDPAAADLRAVGRALVLSHPGRPPARLAADAVRAGFGYVRHHPGRPGVPGDVYAAVAGAAALAIVDVPGGSATPESGFAVLIGQTIALGLDPAPPPGATVRWSVIPCGAGRASVTGPADRPRADLLAERPGDLVAEAQVRHRGRFFTATRTLRVGVAEVPAGTSIAADGRTGVPAPGPLRPDEKIHPAYLTDAPDRFRRPPGSDPRTRRVHPVVAARLAALAALLPPGDPELRTAWDPAATGPAAAGRLITLARGTSTATLARLGALAHAAGFSFVTGDGTTLTLAQDDGPALSITGPAVVDEGAEVELRLPRAAPSALTLAAGLVWTVNTGTGSVSAVDPATGTVEACLKVGLGPRAISATPDGARLVVADAGESALTVITTGAPAATPPVDPAVAGRIPLAAAPADVVCHPAGTRAYAALANGDLAEVDPVARTVTRTVALGAPVVAVRCEPSGSRVWAATAAGRLHAVTLPGFTVTTTVTLAGPPGGLAVGTSRAYVTVPGAGSLQVISLGSGTVQTTYADAGSRPAALALSPGGDALSVVDAAAGRLLVRGADGSPGAPGLPSSLSLPGVAAVATGPGRMYVVSAGPVADTAGVLDAAGGALLGSWPLGCGLGERLVWSVRVTGGAEARLSGTTRPVTTVAGVRAGPARVRAVLQWPGDTPPYAFRVDLSEQVHAVLAGGGDVVLRKDQYDLVMNVLNHLCPIGVEVDTRMIRAHVLELRESLLEAFPPYTYPDFRTRGPRPPGWTFGLDR